MTLDCLPKTTQSTFFSPKLKKIVSLQSTTLFQYINTVEFLSMRTLPSVSHLSIKISHAIILNDLTTQF